MTQRSPALYPKPPHSNPTRPHPGLHLAPPPTSPHRRPSPLALWHLLSLDAPTVAALWTMAIARSCRLNLPASVPLAMAVAVWMLYAADRLLDARLLDARPLDPHLLETPSSTRPTPAGLEARHLFHHRHRRRFLLALGLASVLLATLLPRLNGEAIRLDLLLGALLFAWFVLIHATGNPHRLPKEFAVGLFFAAAVFVPTVARLPGLRPTLLPEALLFGALCTLNCLFIYAWEHTAPSHSRPHATTRLALRHLHALAAATALAACALVLVLHQPLAIAIAMSAGLLLLLDRTRARIAPVHLRAAADLALLTPLLLLPLLALHR